MPGAGTDVTQDPGDAKYVSVSGLNLCVSALTQHWVESQQWTAMLPSLPKVPALSGVEAIRKSPHNIFWSNLESSINGALQEGRW